MESLESLPNDLSNLDVIKSRPRSNSTSVLQTPPKPETTINSYAKERLESGLLYVTTKLKRDLTPRTKDFLCMHQEAYQTALENTRQRVEDVEESLKEVQTFDKIYCSHAFLNRTIPTPEMDCMKALLRIRESEILARYGDYLAQEVQDFRTDVYATRNDEEEEEDMRTVRPSFSNERLWTEIAEIMEVEGDEVEDWKRRPGGTESLQRNVRWALKKACATLGLDNEHMYWAIQQYATRNRRFHSNINTHIARCEWLVLARYIHVDLRDLPLVMGLKAAAPFEQSVKNIRDRYFEIHYPDKPDTWFPNQHAIQLTRDKYKKEQQRQERLKRRTASEEVKPEESRRAKGKEKREKAASMTDEKDERLMRLKLKAPGMENASTQTDEIDGA